MFVFPCFSCTMEIQFPHVLGIVWISASHKTFEKPITLESLRFLILFLYYGNPLSPCFGNCMDFSFTQSIWETHKFEMFVLSHTFLYYGNPRFPCFGNCIFKKPINLKCLCFPVLLEFTFLVFWELYGFLLHAKYVRNPWLWNILFSHTFPVLSEFTFPMFWGQCYWCEN